MNSSQETSFNGLKSLFYWYSRKDEQLTVPKHWWHYRFGDLHRCSSPKSIFMIDMNFSMVSYLVEGASFERIEQMTWATNIQNSSISFNTRLMESMPLSWELATSDKNWDSVPTSIWANDITDFNGIVTEKIMEHHFTDFTFFISIIINTTIIPVASELKIWFKVLLFECYKNLLSKLDDHGPKIASRCQYVPLDEVVA